VDERVICLDKNIVNVMSRCLSCYIKHEYSETVLHLALSLIWYWYCVFNCNL